VGAVVELSLKIAAFDYDWTLVKPKDEKTFPRDINDWQWLRESVPEVLKKLHEDGYSIVVFTNQTKAWKLEQIRKVMSLLDIPVKVAVGITKTYQKPNTVLFDMIIKHKWDKDASFYVGDALGRVNDWSDSDKLFANKVGIKYMAPEEIFMSNKPKTNVDKSDKQEIMIMVGYPGSGKSTIVEEFKKYDNYAVLHGDDLKTPAKLLKGAENAIKDGMSVIIDATNPSVEKREPYIRLANKYKIKARCVHVNTSFEESLARNNKRDKQVPKIAYYVYRKKFEEPSKKEGCEVIVV
jgi:bifunctional polynucleotide phosphatase/kinase